MTKNACTNLEIYHIWSKINTEEVQPRPANAAARQMKTDQQQDNASLGDTFAQALKTALSEHSKQMITKFKDMNMTTNESATSNSNDNSSNEPSNPYLHVVLPSSTPSPSNPIPSNDLPTPPDLLQHNPQAHVTKMPSILGPLLVADSGCTHTMAGLLHLFQSITYYDPHHRSEVTLGDNSTCCQIYGYGYITVQLKSYTIRLLALYVPALGDTTLLSIKQHMQWRGAFFHAENHQATLAFPTFSINMFVHNEIEHPLEPSTRTGNFDFDEAHAIPSTINTSTSTCRLVKQNILDHLPSPQDYHQFTNTVTFQQLAPEVIIPSKSTPGSIGYDVHSLHSVEIFPGQIAKVNTGLAVAMPDQMY